MKKFLFCFVFAFAFLCLWGAFSSARSLVHSREVNGRRGDPDVAFEALAGPVGKGPHVIANANGLYGAARIKVARARATLGRGEALEHLDSWRLAKRGQVGAGHCKGHAVASFNGTRRKGARALTLVGVPVLLRKSVHEADLAPAQRQTNAHGGGVGKQGIPFGRAHPELRHENADHASVQR
jgi:hypothetical protein